MLANMPLIWNMLMTYLGICWELAKHNQTSWKMCFLFFVGSWGLQIQIIQEPGKTPVVKRLKVNIFGPGRISGGLNCLVCFPSWDDDGGETTTRGGGRPLELWLHSNVDS